MGLAGHTASFSSGEVASWYSCFPKGFFLSLFCVWSGFLCRGHISSSTLPCLVSSHSFLPCQLIIKITFCLHSPSDLPSVPLCLPPPESLIKTVIWSYGITACLASHLSFWFLKHFRISFDNIFRCRNLPSWSCTAAVPSLSLLVSNENVTNFIALITFLVLSYDFIVQKFINVNNVHLLLILSLKK